MPWCTWRALRSRAAAGPSNESGCCGAAVSNRRERSFTEPGLTHLSFSVDDISATCALVAWGIALTPQGARVSEFLYFQF